MKRMGTRSRIVEGRSWDCHVAEAGAREREATAGGAQGACAAAPGGFSAEPSGELGLVQGVSTSFLPDTIESALQETEDRLIEAGERLHHVTLRYT